MISANNKSHLVQGTIILHTLASNNVKSLSSWGQRRKKTVEKKIEEVMTKRKKKKLF